MTAKTKLKKELKALGLKTYLKTGTQESFVRKGDVKRILASLHRVVADKLPGMAQLDKMIKAELEKAFSDVEDDYELYSTGAEKVSTERSSGFSPHTQGGYQIRGFQTEMGLISSGNMPADAKASKAIEDGYAYNEEIAAEEIWDKNEAKLKGAGFKGPKELNYQAMNDKGLDDLAEHLSDLVDDYSRDDSSEILFGMGVFYYEPEGDSKIHSVYVYSEINWEAPYFRTGKGASVAPFEEDIDFETAGELRPLLIKALGKAAASISSSGKPYAGSGAEEGEKAPVVRINDRKMF